jgi:rfaE bifunctional protein kinase chain/domain
MNILQLETILAQFPTLTLLVVGDYFLDLYLDIDSALAETSLETGLEVHQITRLRTFPGAAGTVTSNLRALGVNVIALGAIGEDGNGYELKRALSATGVDISQLIESRERVTPTYVKPLRDGRELNRLDVKNRTATPRAIEEEIILRLRELAPRVNGVIVVDQVQEENGGVITERVREAITTLARDRIVVAESRERIGLFRNVVVQANAREAKSAAGLQDIEACGCALAKRNRGAIITVGAEGILAFDETGGARAPGVKIESQIDTVGAGDSVCAGFTAALCAGASLRAAAEIGNLVAAVTIQQIGVTGTATPAQIIALQYAIEKNEGRVK